MSILGSLAGYHVVTYGTLLGTVAYQSFVGGTVAYKALPRPQFSSLQQKIFPIYFGIQTALPVVLALTYPGSKTSLGTASSLSGVVAEANRMTVLMPLAAMFVAGLANLVYGGPATTSIMKERKHQETRDGKKSYDPPPHSTEMQRLNRQFGKMHGISTLINLGGLIVTIWYGFELGKRLS